ncbi:MAG: hypothetical protein R3C01_01630 [Planctomycetaceae bacterium]
MRGVGNREWRGEEDSGETQFAPDPPSLPPTGREVVAEQPILISPMRLESATAFVTEDVRYEFFTVQLWEVLVDPNGQSLADSIQQEYSELSISRNE